MDSDSNWRDSCSTIGDTNLHLLNSGKLSDILFLIGDTKEAIHAHKFILIARSSMIETRFGDRWDDADEIEIPNVSPKAFRLFLEYLYADKFSVTANDALEVLYLADKFMTKCLTKKCSDVLVSVIRVSNVIYFHQIATKFKLKNLEKKAMQFILRNGSAVFKDKGFLKIDKGTLSSILKSDDLIADEIDIFRAVMRWAEKKNKADELDETVFYDLIQNIRFTLINPEDFTNEVATGQYAGILSTKILNKICAYRNAETSKRSNLSLHPFNVNPRFHEVIHKVDVYDAGVGYYRGLHCRYDSIGDSATLCEATLEFRSNQNIHIKGIELRLPTPSLGVLVNSTYLAFTESGSPNAVQSRVYASIFKSGTSSVEKRLDGIFVQRSLSSGFERGVQIKQNVNYYIKLSIEGGAGGRLIKFMPPGVGLKLANPAEVVCEENSVEFTFITVSTKCSLRHESDDWNELPKCVCKGLIKKIHFTI